MTWDGNCCPQICTMSVRHLDLVSRLRVVFAARSLALHCKSSHVLVTVRLLPLLGFSSDAYIHFVRRVSTSNFCEPKMLRCLHTFCEACIATFCAKNSSLFAHVLQRLLRQSFRIVILLHLMRLDMVRHVEFIDFCQCQDWFSLRVEVPAIWREVSKQFMREEVLRAGFACNYCGLNNTSSDICIDDSSFATYSCKSQLNVLSVWTFEGFGIYFRFCEVTSHQLALRR